MQTMLRFYFLIPCLLLIACQDDDQLTLQANLIKNPSFENSITGLNTLPLGWENCGDLLPDIFPISEEENTRQCSKIAFDGANFIGLMANENGEKSCINYIFSEPVTTGDSLSISMHLERSPVYLIEVNGESKNFSTPLQLEIYGITSEGNILMHTTTTVINTRWLTFSKIVSLPTELQGLSLRPKFIDSNPINGNLLIDNLDFRVVL